MNVPISYRWLESHFDKKLPEPEEISGLFMKHLCEVEAMEKHGDDTIFDLKILPDRGHDLLAHLGIAREVSVLANIPLKETVKKESRFCGIGSRKSSGRDQLVESVPSLRVEVREQKLCPRYMGRVIEGVSVGESPAWLRAFLESVGQRSINNIVDITNFVMLELGQPMHAFDAAKLARGKDGAFEIFVRKAHTSERMITLDGKDIVLSSETLVIADSAQSLAIAGVKGGRDAGVDQQTTTIIFEAANFDAVNTRRTSERVGIRTDSSCRFEHNISPVLAEEAMQMATELVLEMCPEACVGAVVDVYPAPVAKREFGVSVAELNAILGTKLSGDAVEDIVKRLGFTYRRTGDAFSITPPAYRLDLLIKEDLAEEIGRVYGYENIIPTPISELSFKAESLKTYVYANIIRDVLVAQGFSEVYTYSFQKEGVFAVANPIAEDKGFLRKDLSAGVSDALLLNARNAPLLGLDAVKIFEIGKVFPRVGEEKLSCAFAVDVLNAGKKKDARTKEVLQSACDSLSAALGVSVPAPLQGNIVEIDLGALLEKLLKPIFPVTPFKAIETRYQKISIYPYMLRDIALWVPEGVSSDVVHNMIRKEAGELLAFSRLFDVFTKEFPDGKKTSYAFNLVFQSHKKTLSDEEVNGVMERVTKVLAMEGGWTVR